MKKKEIFDPTMKDFIIVQLSLLCQIPPQGKLRLLPNGDLTIEDRPVLTGILRWWGNDSRHNTIHFLWNLYNSTDELLNTCSERDTLDLLDYVRGSLKGIKQLIMTYNTDLYVQNHLRMLYQRVERLISRHKVASSDEETVGSVV